MAMYNEEMPAFVFLCEECDELYYDEPDTCMCGCSEFREVSKGDMGYLD